MKKTAGTILWILLLLAMSRGNVRADSIECKGGIVSAGDSRVDLVMKCGEPDGKDSHDEELIERMGQGERRKIVITVDEWTYNFGPAQLIRVVTLKNGRIVSIRTGGYGYGASANSDQRECSEQAVSIGDSKNDVLSKCGKPSWKDVHQEEVRERLDSGLEKKVYSSIEEWTYNLGPGRFVRILIFRNNKLVDIKTGGYGYDLKHDDKSKSP